MGTLDLPPLAKINNWAVATAGVCWSGSAQLVVILDKWRAQRPSVLVNKASVGWVLGPGCWSDLSGLSG